MTGNYMEKALLKLAKQINAYDEASLMELWEKFAEKVRRFEPTSQWEEAVISLNIIQGMRFKNQLFNHNWARSREPSPQAEFDLAALTAPERKDQEIESEKRKSSRPGKLLQLKPVKED